MQFPWLLSLLSVSLLSLPLLGSFAHAHSPRGAQELTRQFKEDVTMGRVLSIGHKNPNLPLFLRMTVRRMPLP